MKNVSSFVCLAVAVMTGIGWSQGFTISGTNLIDANNNNFIMKGINVPLAWFVSDVNNNIANIKNKTGANCFRIVVTTSTADNAWQTCVNNCITNKVVPMVELHDVTGNTDANRLNDMAKFWVNKKSFLTGANVAKYILINIANEWGDWAMANNGQAKWRDAYLTAIKTMRDGGINTTLVIDACDWGQDLRNCNTIKAHAKELMDSDPKKNLLFSVHMYCEWAVNGGSSITTGLPSVKTAGIPIIVGEFGYQHDNGNGGTCDITETDILNTCQSSGIGWLAWSWKGNGSPVQYLDLSSDWAGNSLSTWGSTVVNGANGTKTAVTAGVYNGIYTATGKNNISAAPGRDLNFNAGSRTITLIGITGTTILTLFDMSGKLVAEQAVSGKSSARIPITFVPGIYLVKAVNAQNTLVSTLFVK